MSVLIKGMKMPKSCYDCQFAVDGTCVATGKGADDCPLIPDANRVVNARMDL